MAYDGEEALRICRESHPDIVVSDIQMPRMNGYKLCKHIKEDLEISHIPVILLTARNDEESKTFGYKNGADAYQTKPFEVDILYTIIQSQLKTESECGCATPAQSRFPNLRKVHSARLTRNSSTG